MCETSLLCAYGQSDQSLCWLLEYFMTLRLLAEHHLVFLNLKGGCTGSSESTLVKMPHCLKSHVVVAQLYLSCIVLVHLLSEVVFSRNFEQMPCQQ